MAFPDGAMVTGQAIVNIIIASPKQVRGADKLKGFREKKSAPTAYCWVHKHPTKLRTICKLRKSSGPILSQLRISNMMRTVAKSVDMEPLKPPSHLISSRGLTTLVTLTRHDTNRKTQISLPQCVKMEMH